jgi:Rrf2 family transcriptional regulator, nitric oxide-sensitive transcriptional repressor
LQLTLHADYSLRVLLYLAENAERAVSTQEISDAYGISRHHLVRVVQTLHTHSFVNVSAGRKGGASLARLPREINLGEVVRKAEPSFRIVECFDKESNTCPIVPVCKLKKVLQDALEGFFQVLDGYTLADLVDMPQGRRISDLLQIALPNPALPHTAGPHTAGRSAALSRTTGRNKARR